MPVVVVGRVMFDEVQSGLTDPVRTAFLESGASLRAFFDYVIAPGGWASVPTPQRALMLRNTSEWSVTLPRGRLFPDRRAARHRHRTRAAALRRQVACLRVDDRRGTGTPAETFINKGVNGRWRDVLSPAEIEKAAGLAAKNLTPDCAAWVMRS